MEVNNTVKALDNLDSTLKKFNEQIDGDKTSDTNKDPEPEQNDKEKEDASENEKDKDEKGNETDSDKGATDTKKTGDQDNVKDNQKQTFDQFNVKPPRGEESFADKSTSTAAKPRRPSAEEIAKNWQELGVKRCNNCRFTTDDTELFKQHCTTCLSVKSTGNITFTYKDEEFMCNTCNEAWKIKAEFEEHIVCHLQDWPYVCLTCQNRKFPSRQLIEIHTKTDHPEGNARCGLKGMKNGRKYCEELMQLGTISINGKLVIPKTPKNHANQIVSKELINQKQEMSSKVESFANAVKSVAIGGISVNNPTNTTVLPSQLTSESIVISRHPVSIVSGATIHHRPVLINMIKPAQAVPGVSQVITSNANPTKIVTPITSALALPVILQAATTAPNASVDHNATVINDSDAEVIANRPMPPARTTVTFQTIAPYPYQYTSKGGTLTRVSPAEEAKSKHLDTLFGQINRSTNVMQPTFISQKIKDIANPLAGDSNRTQSEASRKEPIPYQLKTITEYTCTQPTKTTSSTVSSLPQQNVLLVPVGQPVNISQQGQILNNMFYQQARSTGNFVPIQPLPVSIGSNDTNLRMQQPPSQITQRLPFNQIPQMLTTSSATTVRNVNNTSVRSSVQNTTVNFGTVQSSTRPVVLPQDISGKNLNVQQSLAAPISFVNDILTIPKKYLFKIKPGIGFVCEACKKCTREEYVFRRHVWEHFHREPLACKTCSPDCIASKNILDCKLVNNIVCNLIRRSTQDNLEATARSHKVSKVGEKEVIDITDDDENQEDNQQDQDLLATEVIVLDDEDENGETQGLQIRISNTFSLSSPNNLEPMGKKDAQSNNETMSSDVQNRDKREEGNKQSAYNDLISDKGQPKQSGNGDTVADLQNSQKQKDTSHDNSEAPENTNDGKQSPDVIVGEEDDDGELKDSHLLDQSLSEPGNNSQEIVSKVLETNLKVYDPSVNESKDNETFEEVNQISKMSYNYMQSDVSSKTQQEDQDENLNLVNKTIFDTEVLSKQSQHAFYVCGYENCTYTGLSSIKYREHLQSKQHEREYNYVCGHCGQKDYTEDAHVRHIFSHANAKRFLLYKCPMHLCKYKTNLLHMYTCHLRAHPNEELIIKCIYCHKMFPSIESLEQHLKQNLLKFVVCPYCSFKFVNKHTVMLHIRFFHPDKMRMVSVTSQVVCYEREINFYVPPKSKVLYEPGLREKDLEETGSIDFPALLNDFQKESCAKEKHATEQILLGKESENGDGDDALSLPEEDQCDLHKESESKEPKGHQKEIADKKVTKGKGKTDTYFKGGPKSLECPHCSYLSYNQSLHAKHISIHDTEPEREKRFVCNLCPKGTEGLSHFITHVKNHVGKNTIKVFCCTACSYCSNQKRHIMDHVKDAHAKEALYTLKEEVIESNHFECKYCSFKARTTEQVTAHETSVHRINQNVVSNNEKQDGQKSSPSENESSFDSGNDARKKKCKYHCEYCNDFFKHKSNLKEHMVNDHKDIENKQFIFFKCKYCTYTSTMKDMIISHLEKDHSGQDLRILRKIEKVENGNYVNVRENNDAGIVGKEGKSSTEGNDDPTANASMETDEQDKIEIVVPDGNIFKQIFSCPICSFTTNMRLKAMKHLKEHPGVKPIRPNQKKTSTKPTARKSSTSLFPKNDLTRKKNSLIQQLPMSAKPLQNPFTAVKESAGEENILSGESKAMLNSPSKDTYILGEQKLHAALSACFIPFEKDMKYQCRICKQKIFKRFVLHRHILDHLKIVFFKCRYCEEGSIERTLMVGHIQKVHSSKSILYDSVEVSVLEQQFKERIFRQDFNDTLNLSDASGTQQNRTGDFKNIVKKPVHEYQTIDDESNDEEDEDSDKTKITKEESREVETRNILQCLQCRYLARTKHHLNLHLDSHKDPMKVYTCSVCDYRGDKFSVIKHIYSVPHPTQAKVLENGKSLYEKLTNEPEKEQKEQIKSDSSKSDSKSSISNTSKKDEEEDQLSTDSKYVINSQGKQVKKDALTITKSGIFEMKTSFKCKECGEKRESKSGMYAHFKTKCNKPVMKCSLCSFQNTVKAAIYRHASKRHSGKKITVLNLPMSAKFKLIKIPVRQDKGMMKHLPSSSSFDSAESLSEALSDANEADGSDEEQIRCQLCASYSCESAMKLQFHINTTHQGTMLYCKECSYKTPLVRHMMNHCQNLHLQKVARYAKEPVKKTVPNIIKQEKVSKPVNIISDDQVVMAKCPKCDKKFTSVTTVLKHLYIHFNYKPFCCKYCDSKFSREDHCKLHVKAVHSDKPEQYDMKTDEAIEQKIKKLYESAKRSTIKQKMMLGKFRPAKLNKMELIEEGIRRKDKLFYCDFCQYSSDRKATIRKHVSAVHAGISKKRPLVIDSDTELPAKKFAKKTDGDTNDTSIDEEEDDENEQEEELQPLKYKVVKTPTGSKKFKCTGCDYMNPKKKNLKLHVARHHSVKTEPAFKCLSCFYTSANSSKMYTHYKCHHPTMKTVKFVNKVGEVVTQDMNERSSPGKFSRSSCSPARTYTESGSSDASPVKPVKTKLNGVTRYNCIYCSYSGIGLFHFRLHLVMHEEFTELTTELDDESKMACGFCTYLGKNTFDLSVHIASHMAEQRYKCVYCDYTQFCISKISQHLKKSHPDRQEIVFDREFRKASNGKIQLVNLNPEVKIDNIGSGSRKRKYKRIMIETDESSNNSSSDREDDKINSKSKETLDESGKAKRDVKDTQFVEGKDGNSKNDKERLPNETGGINDHSVQLGEIQNDKDDDNESDDDELMSAPFYKVESQPFSPSDVNELECDELNENEPVDDVDSKINDVETNKGENESVTLMFESRETVEQKSETSNSLNDCKDNNKDDLNNLISSGTKENDKELTESQKPEQVKHKDDECSLPECESDERNSKIPPNKSVDELISNENKSAGNDHDSVENEVKEGSGIGPNVGQNIEQTITTIELGDTSKGDNDDIKEGNTSNENDHDSEKMEYKNENDCDNEKICENNDYDSSEQKNTSGEVLENDTGAITSDEGDNKSKTNEDKLFGDESLCENENSGKDAKCEENKVICSSTNSNKTLTDEKEVQNELNKSERNVFESISDVKKFHCEEINKDGADTNKHGEVNSEKNGDLETTLKEVGNENVFEKFSSEIDHIQPSNVTHNEESDEKSPEEKHDNIFEKFSNNTETKVGDSENETAGKSDDDTDKNIFESFAKDTDKKLTDDIGSNNFPSATLDGAEEKTDNPELKESMDNDGDSNIFTKFSADNLEVPVPGVSEDRPNSPVRESNIFSKFSNSESKIESKSDEEDDKLVDNDKNLFEKFAKESGSNELSSSLVSKNEGNQSLKNSEEKSLGEEEKNVEDMEIDELIDSIEKTVNEGKSQQSEVEKYNNEFEKDNCEMEVD